ncbi:hypothetical protein AEM42_02345 [Betaproteobacteria bacterium UKL13-2]|jgi:hypothetical protein|nr:hypothetical protein AEM42_02345 [Betaproteobacteria bacterium UKL13-2]HCG53671.1 hypothetical protein [Betaproteobacteria bacterium]
MVGKVSWVEMPFSRKDQTYAAPLHMLWGGRKAPSNQMLHDKQEKLRTKIHQRSRKKRTTSA